MNLKEAFRFQNKLQSMMDEADAILGLNSNITKVQNTYLRHKVMAEAEDETTTDDPPTEYGEKITELAKFLLHLLTEREKLSTAIHSIPNSLSIGFGSQAVRKKLVELYKDSETMFTGTNEHGETVYLSIAASGIVLKTEQANGWVRVNYYDADGFATGEGFDGKWRTANG